MFGTWMTLTLIELPVVALAQNSSGNCWSVDKLTVTRGGCVTIVVNEPCNRSRNLRLQIDQDEPRQLIDLGPSYSDRNSRVPGRDSTLVLLFWDVVNPKSVTKAPGRPGEFTWLPIFDDPGTVRLTLWSGGESLGFIDVTVQSGTPASDEAVELLAPRLAPREKPKPGEITWLDLFNNLSGVTRPLDSGQVERLRDQLPIVAQHPDWAEVAEMLLSRLEARVVERSVTAKGEDGYPMLGKDTTRVELPQLVARNLHRKVTSPFAQAVQDDLRSMVGEIHLAAQRRDRTRSE